MMERSPSHNPELHGFLRALAWAEADLSLQGLPGDLAELRTLWERHVGDTEERLFPSLVAASPAADRLVGFFLAEHADLTARLAALEERSPSADRARATIQLSRRLIQHILLEARILSPLEGTDTGGSPDSGARTARGPDSIRQTA